MVSTPIGSRVPHADKAGPVGIWQVTRRAESLDLKHIHNGLDRVAAELHIALGDLNSPTLQLVVARVEARKEGSFGDGHDARGLEVSNLGQAVTQFAERENRRVDQSKDFTCPSIVVRTEW